MLQVVVMVVVVVVVVVVEYRFEVPACTQNKGKTKSTIG
jgi:hypothetical protein